MVLSLLLNYFLPPFPKVPRNLEQKTVCEAVLLLVKLMTKTTHAEVYHGHQSICHYGLHAHTAQSPGALQEHACTVSCAHPTTVQPCHLHTK